LDEETGLTVYGTGYPGSDTFAAGYNREVRRYIRKHGLPANSMKQWAPVLLDLAKYWKEQSAGSAPAAVLPNAGPVDYRGWRLALTTHKQAWSSNGRQWLEDSFEFHVSADGRSHVRRLDERDVQKIECCSGPAGSGFAVLRLTTVDRQVFYALDVRSGRWLPTRPATSPLFNWRDEQ